jgi:DNA-binding CsgD family transcriptional regulator
MGDLELSSREKQLLRRLALRKSDQEIAISIGGTARQVAVQRERLLKKLNLTTQSEIVEAAARLAAWPKKST